MLGDRSVPSEGNLNQIYLLFNQFSVLRGDLGKKDLNVKLFVDILLRISKTVGCETGRNKFREDNRTRFEKGIIFPSSFLTLAHRIYGYYHNN